MDLIKDLDKLIESKIDRSKWQKWKFSDLVENINEKVVPKDSGLDHYIGLEHLDSGSLHIGRFGETKTLVGDKLKIYKGDIIFAKRNAYLKRVAVAQFEAIASAHSLVLRARPENVLPEFLPFFLLSETFWKNAIEISVGSLSPTINWPMIAKQVFELPSKETQIKIAKLFWASEDLIRENVSLLEKASIAKEALIKSYISKSEFHKTIKDLGRIVTGSTPSTSSHQYWGGEVPFVTPADISDSPRVKSSERFITAEGATKSRLIPKNSILTVCIGSTIGKISICDFDCCTNQQINALIPNKEYDPVYILYLLRYFKPRILAKTGVTAVPIVNKSEFESINLPILRPDLIEKFVNDMNKYSQVIDDIDKNIAFARCFQNSLINYIF